MRRILLATSAVVALATATSPAWAFNLPLPHNNINDFDQFGGGNFGTNYQVSDHNGYNILTGSQSGFGNYIDNGYCTKVKNNECKQGVPGQDSDEGLNFAGIYQGGVGNIAVNRQKSGKNNANFSVVGQGGFFNVDLNSQNAKGQGSYNGSLVLQGGFVNIASTDQNASNGNHNNSAQLQYGAFNLSTVSQDTDGSKNGDKGNNSSLVAQAGAFSHSDVDQKGNNDQLTLQAGFGNGSSTAQDGTKNEAATVQLGLGNNSSTDQSGTNNESQTFQAGIGNQASVTQTGDGKNWSSVGQVGGGNTFISFQTAN